MRAVLAGIILLSLCSVTFAQAKGEVESIGFNGAYRPDCWTPMVVRLTPDTPTSQDLQIQVHQKDLDGDDVYFTRTVTLTGNEAGQPPRQQRFFMYFIPQPVKTAKQFRGLPDTNQGATLQQLQDELQVAVCTTSGRQIAALPVTQTITNVDPGASQIQALRRGTRFVLAVSDGTSQPRWQEYTADLGLLENVIMVSVNPRDLPENEIGYESVDAILWLNHPPTYSKNITDDKLPAIRNYINHGGRLVVCQPGEWSRNQIFDDLLPVTLREDAIQTKADLRPLTDIARIADLSESSVFQFARAAVKPGAIVDQWIYWPATDAKPDAPANRSPYIARQSVGLGSVTWVAQNLGDPAIARALDAGWSRIWDRVFDWKNDPIVPYPKMSDEQKVIYKPAQAVDLGTSLLGGMELSSRSAAYISLAILFFLVYWVIAGPGIYFWLRTRKTTHLSWFLFGAMALGATGLTVLLVRLVVRGPPELGHVTLVRMAPGQPAIALSRFGLYIPRDGQQKIELKDTAPRTLCMLSPYAAHPQHADADLTFIARAEYTLPVRDANSADPAIVRIPYRSTLKRLQAQWIGSLPGIDGKAKLVSRGFIDGKLINNTGLTLEDVYLAFKYPGARESQDWVLYIPSWKNGDSLDLNQEFNRQTKKDGSTEPIATVGLNGATVGKDYKLNGMIGHPGREQHWEPFWFKSFRSTAMMDNSLRDPRAAFPLLSLFDRLPPMMNPRDGTAENRSELLRRGGRMFDLSQAISAGQLVILAEAPPASPLPFPMEVDGVKIAGQGTTFFQFVIPLDRSAVEGPSQN